MNKDKTPIDDRTFSPEDLHDFSIRMAELAFAAGREGKPYINGKPLHKFIAQELADEPGNGNGQYNQNREKGTPPAFGKGMLNIFFLGSSVVRSYHLPQLMEIVQELKESRNPSHDYSKAIGDFCFSVEVAYQEEHPEDNSTK